MEKEKNLTSNNGSVDEELLSRFFADSARMSVADGGFSRRVMLRLSDEVPERQRVVYNVWTAVWTVACVVVFFVNGGVGWIKGLLGGAYSSIVVALPKSMPDIDFSPLMGNAGLRSLVPADVSSAQPLMVALIVVVLGSVAVWDAAQE